MTSFPISPKASPECTGVPYELPPLILYPFDHRPDPNQGAQSNGFSDPATQPYLDARYNELRSLCLIGKDLNRWLEQCVEVASVDPALAGLSECDFIAALLFAPPKTVVEKMRIWGVRNFQLICSRAIGLNAVFPHPPSASDVSEPFLRRFHKYADSLYDERSKSDTPVATRENRFTFAVYSSGEYATYLEKIWEE